MAEELEAFMDPLSNAETKKVGQLARKKLASLEVPFNYSLVPPQHHLVIFSVHIVRLGLG